MLGELVGEAVGSWIGGESGRFLRRAPKGERRVAAACRDRLRRGLAGRWRHGHIRARDDDLAWVADRLRSVRRTPIDLSGVRILRERDPRAWEHVFLGGDLRVLTCALPGGLVDLAIPRDDVRFVRGAVARSRP